MVSGEAAYAGSWAVVRLCPLCRDVAAGILARAFRGDLAPTEAELAKPEGRSYESAEELLARSKAQPPADTKGKRRSTVRA